MVPKHFLTQRPYCLGPSFTFKPDTQLGDYVVLRPCEFTEQVIDELWPIIEEEVFSCLLDLYDIEFVACNPGDGSDPLYRNGTIGVKAKGRLSPKGINKGLMEEVKWSEEEKEELLQYCG